jgi:hypothetical protein
MVECFFRETQNLRKRTTLLCSIWSIPTIWNIFIFFVVFESFRSRICYLSSFSDYEDSTPWVIYRAPIAKVGWWFHGQILMKSWDARSKYVDFLEQGNWQFLCFARLGLYLAEFIESKSFFFHISGCTTPNTAVRQGSLLGGSILLNSGLLKLSLFSYRILSLQKFWLQGSLISA